MAERAYTVSEIDALKKAHKNKFIWGFYSGSPLPNDAGYIASGVYDTGDLIIQVDSGVRISMLAGHTAEDLTASERPNQ